MIDRSTLGSLGLSALALANQLLFYSINLVLARNLSAAQFDRYCFAISTTLVLSTIATLGLEKYALRCLPAYLERGDPARALGYWRFSIRAVILCSLALIAVFAIGLAGSLWTVRTQPYKVILYLVAFLPAIALSLFLLEVITANGRPMIAAAIYRFVLPSTFLLLVLSLRFDLVPLSATSALIAYGAAWTVTLVLMWLVASRNMPRAVSSAKPVLEPPVWLRQAVPFLLNSMLMTLLAQSGVIVLGFVSTKDAAVGSYAVAAQIGTFVVLLATSTNRYYLPRMSVLMERRDYGEMLVLARKRLRLIGGIAGVYVLVTVAFGKTILGVFGPEFRAAYPALCWLTAGAAVSTMFSVAPYFLQFSGKHGFVLRATAIAAIANVVLAAFLGRRLGVTGVAIAYASSLATLFVFFRVAAWRRAERGVTD